MSFASDPRRLGGRILAGLAALSPAAAQGESVTSVLGVTATIAPSCSISLTPVAFGSVAAGEAAEASGSLSVSCTNGTAWTASADAGSGTGASPANRKMSNGSHQLSYVLFGGAERNRPWGDGSGATATIGGTGSGNAQSFPIHGQIVRNQQAIPAGTYSDVVAVTVTY